LSSPTCLDLGFRETRGLRLPKPLLDVRTERIDEQQLAAGAVGLVVAIHAAAPRGFSQREPVGGSIAGPGEPLAFR